MVACPDCDTPRRASRPGGHGRGANTLRLIAITLALGVAAIATRTSTASAEAGIDPDSAYVDQLLALLNQEREQAGVPALRLCADRSIVASWRSSDMASRQYFAHANPEGIGAEQLLFDYPIEFGLFGENIARTDHSAGEMASVVHTAFMASPGHRANVLDRDFRQVGIAVASNGSTHYVTVIFTD